MAAAAAAAAVWCVRWRRVRSLIRYRAFEHYTHSGVKDPKYEVPRIVMAMFRDSFEDALLLKVFKRLGPHARKNIDVAE